MLYEGSRNSHREAQMALNRKSGNGRSETNVLYGTKKGLELVDYLADIHQDRSVENADLIM